MTWKELRERIGLTTNEMARELGMSKQLYSLKENYKRSMKLEEALAIQKIAERNNLYIDLNDIRRS